MEFKIKDLGEIRVVGLKQRIHTSEENHNGIPELWQNITKSGMLSKLQELNDGELVGVVGVCTNYSEDGSMDYYVGVDSSKSFEGSVELVVEGAKYAVFECEMTNIQETWREIFTQWLPTSEYEFANLPSIEYYPNKEVCEIYIPILM